MTEIHENDAAAVALISGAVSAGIARAEQSRLQREDPLNHPTVKSYACRSCGLVDVMPVDSEPTGCRCGAPIDMLAGAEDLVRERDRIEFDERMLLNNALLEQSETREGHEPTPGDQSITSFMQAAGGVNRDGSRAAPMTSVGITMGSKVWQEAMTNGQHPGHGAVVAEYHRHCAECRAKGVNPNDQITMDRTPENLMDVNSVEFRTAFQSQSHPQHHRALAAAQHFSEEAHASMESHREAEAARASAPIHPGGDHIAIPARSSDVTQEPFTLAG